MIRGIRRRFMGIAIGVLALAMVLVAVIINGANWVNVRGELYETLGYLGEWDAQKDFQGPGMRGGVLPGRRDNPSRHMRNMMNEARFFSVTVAEDGSCALDDATHVAEEDAGVLVELATRALARGRTSGFYGDYLFRVDGESGERVALFLNCETKLTRVRRLALISAAACGGCVLLAWLLVGLFSSRAIRPLVESAIQQKQFITDAGHELKTPLTVISANMDVLALETGDNEWIRSTRKQVANLRGLVGELIYLSRLDEEDAKLQRVDVDLSALVRESAEPFVGMAEFAGKTLDVEAEDGIHVTGDGQMLGRLVSILCDNAVKYAPEGDTIAVTLVRGRKGVMLATDNAVQQPMSDETLRHLFDRFYRADASRSRESGGYGIGLSVALAIAEKHSGSIRVRQTPEGRVRFECSLGKY
ncbi:MAG: two-component sensor histidine kinase [Clostridia bacterium]|nr:two-component sensor histidine kinase [Clostridia bacterium]